MRRVPGAATAGVFAVGLVLTVVVGCLLVLQARADHADRLERTAQVLQTQLSSEVESLEASVEGLRNGLVADEFSTLAWNVDRDQVSHAISRGFSVRALAPARAASLIRAVSADQLAGYEVVLGRDHPGFAVHPRPGADATAHVVEVLHPLAGNEAALGFDLSSEQRRRAMIERARDTGMPTTSEPITLVQGVDDPELAVLLFVPAYAEFDIPDTAPARREQFVGGISLVVMPGALLEASIIEDPHVDIAIVDVGAIGLSGTAQPTSEGTVLLGDPADDGAAQLDLHVGDRRWRLMVNPTEDFGGPNMWPAVLWSAAMLLLTLMSAALVDVLRTGEQRAMSLVDERTAELQASEARLHAANARLTEADALKTSFLVTVSHELRTPVTTIRGFAELLQRPDADLSEEERSTFLAQMAQSAHGLGELLGEVLEFAELEQMGPRVSQITFAIDDVVHEVAEEYRASNAVVLQPADLQVDGDPQQLRRILNSVLENARAYAPAGSAIGIWVRDAGDMVEVVVDDSGPGIPTGDRDRVFQRFFRGRQAADGNVPGTGIGLTVAKQLIEAMGGRIRADAAPGGGARIILGLRRAEGPLHHIDDTAEATA